MTAGMFSWYQASFVCYVYLVDVESSTDVYAALKASRWFTRGWTLQELIAPTNVMFYTSWWTQMGTKQRLCHEISTITGVPVRVFTFEDPVRSYSVAVRMSWAADRETTRTEDVAYCLFGLFDVNLPLLYGEGPKAFRRLQEEIMRTVNDASLFAWSRKKPVYQASDEMNDAELHGFLADRPACFTYFTDAMKRQYRYWNDQDMKAKLTFHEAMIGLPRCAVSDHMEIPLPTAQGIQARWPEVHRNGLKYIVIPCYLRCRDGHAKYRDDGPDEDDLFTYNEFLGLRISRRRDSRHIERLSNGKYDFIWVLASELEEPKNLCFLAPFVSVTPQREAGCRLRIDISPELRRILDPDRTFISLDGQRA